MRGTTTRRRCHTDPTRRWPPRPRSLRRVWVAATPAGTPRWPPSRARRTDRRGVRAGLGMGTPVSRWAHGPEEAALAVAACVRGPPYRCTGSVLIVHDAFMRSWSCTGPATIRRGRRTACPRLRAGGARAGGSRSLLRLGPDPAVDDPREPTRTENQPSRKEGRHQTRRPAFRTRRVLPLRDAARPGGLAAGRRRRERPEGGRTSLAWSCWP